MLKSVTKIKYWGVLLIFTLFFTSCNKSSFSEQSVSSSTVFPANSSTSTTQSFDIPSEPKDLKFHSSTQGATNENGYYEIILRSDGSGNIYYTDFSSKQKLVLCSRPECTHDADGCTGYIACAANIPEIMVTDCSLVLIYPGNPYIGTTVEGDVLAHVEVRDLNGGNPRTIHRFDSNVQLDFNFAFDDSHLYIFQSIVTDGTSSPTIELLQLNLDTGDVNVLKQFTCKLGENYYFIGASDRRLFFKKSTIDETLLESTEGGEYSTSSITNSLLFDLFSYDLTSGSEVVIKSWRAGETIQNIFGNTCFFINNGSIEMHNLQTGETTTVVSNQPYCSPDTIEQVYFADPYLFYNIHYPADNPSDAVIKRYICNIDSLKLHESTLVTNYRGISDPVRILTSTPEYLLVVYALEDVSSQEMPNYYSSLKKKYALCDIQSFVQNQPNYLPIIE